MANPYKSDWGGGDILLTLLTGGLYGAAKLAAPSVYDMKSTYEAEKARKLGRVQMDQQREQFGGIMDRLRPESIPYQDVPTAIQHNPALRSKFAMEMLGSPALSNTGGQLLSNIWNNQAAMQQRQSMGGYADLNQRTSQLRQLAGDANKRLAPHREVLSSYSKLRSIYERAGGNFNNLSGADDQAAIKFVQKMILPNEAVMSDDQIQAVKNSGLWSQVDTWKQWLTENKGAGLGADARYQLYKLAETLRGQATQELDWERQSIDTLGASANIDPAEIYQRRDYGGAIDIKKPVKQPNPKDLVRVR